MLWSVCFLCVDRLRCSYQNRRRRRRINSGGVGKQYDTKIDQSFWYVWRVFDCAPFTFAMLVASVGADGAKAIAKALANNTTLTSIELEGKVFTSVVVGCTFTSGVCDIREQH
jgi:hypothetical protein